MEENRGFKQRVDALSTGSQGVPSERRINQGYVQRVLRPLHSLLLYFLFYAIRCLLRNRLS